jgi:hypothetical protein
MIVSEDVVIIVGVDITMKNMIIKMVIITTKKMNVVEDIVSVNIYIT